MERKKARVFKNNTSLGGKENYSLLICLNFAEFSLSLYTTKPHKLTCQLEQQWPVHVKFKTRTHGFKCVFSFSLIIDKQEEEWWSSSSSVWFF